MSLWMSVNEGLPADDHVEVLAYMCWTALNGRQVREYRIARYIPWTGWVTGHHETNISDQVTYWRPLPPAPGAGPEESEVLSRKLERVRENLRLMNLGKPIKTCPICDSHTFIDEHLCCGDHPEMPEYWVMCSREGCKFQYEIWGGLPIRDELKRSFGEHFIGDYLVDEFLGRPSAGDRERTS